MAAGYNYKSQGYKVGANKKLTRPDGTELDAPLEGQTPPAELARLGYSEADMQAIIAAQRGQRAEDGTVVVDPDAPMGGDQSDIFARLFGRLGGSATGTRPLKLLQGLLGRLQPTAGPRAPSAGGSSSGGGSSTPMRQTGSAENYSLDYSGGSGRSSDR